MQSRKQFFAVPGRYPASIAALLLVLPGTALANTCTVSDHLAAESFVRDLHGYVSGKSGKNAADRAKLNAFIRAKVPVDLVSRYALGIHWRRATNRQRREYQKLFGETVIPGLAEQIVRYRAASYSIADNRSLQSNDRLVVANVRPAKGEILRVGWRLKIENCTATATDMIVDGVSLMVMKRQEYASVISKDGIDGLLKKMRTRAAQIKRGDDGSRRISQPEMGQFIKDLLRGAASKLQ